jgi:putative ABC transport system permease protein
MVVAALELLGLLLALAFVLGLIAIVVVLAVAFIRMAGVTLVQWRDLLSVDRWTEVLVTIGRNKLRTVLTMISVAWGIFVLVTLLGLGRGLDGGMRHQFARDAVNAVWLNASSTSVPYAGYDIGRTITFDNADYDAARKLPGVEYLSGEHYIQTGGAYLSTRYRGKANTFDLQAVHPDAIKISNKIMVAGRFISDADVAQRRKVCVLGQTVVDFLFEGADPIGEWIVFGSVPFEVVGVFEDPDGPEDERSLFVPVSTAQLAFNGGTKLGTLEMTLGDVGPAQSQAMIDKIVAQLAETHAFDPNDKKAVRVHNNIEQFSRFSKLFWMISTFVIVIGLGTLAAGVVGVSNIMMIAVKERTKEIGVRKAIGATPASIVFMVLQESVFVTALSGLLGLTAGVAMLDLLGRMKNDFIYNPGIDLATGIAATGFLVLAGAFAGYFPARAAARVNPIHALRDQ